MRSLRLESLTDKLLRRALYIAHHDFVATGISSTGTAVCTQTTKKTELARGDLGVADMGMVVSLVEVPPGASGLLRNHPGEEAYYVVEGASAERPDGTPFTFEPRTAKFNVRDAPRGAFKNTGDKALKLLTVHLIQKSE
ncbi:putative cupin superfamily protein [Bradyrhizobium sp. USDA 4341]